MTGLLDIHTHILPQMDDGSRSVEESLEMLRAEAQQGVDTVVLTPHFYATREAPDKFLARRAASLEMLQRAMEVQQDLPALRVGAEVAYYEGMGRSEHLENLCIQGTRVVLVEMPFCEWSQRMYNELAEMREVRGIQPILAHVERYLAFQPRDVVERLCAMNMCIQVNAEFFARWQTSRAAIRLLEERLIHFIGTDCHNLKHRSPNYGKAAEKIGKKLGEDAFEYLLQMKDWLLGGTQ